MKLSELISEIKKYSDFLKEINPNQDKNKVKNLVLQKIFSRNFVGNENSNLASFGAYYQKLILECEKISGKTDIDLPQYLYFVLQNFLAHSLPLNLAYIKISSLNRLDLIAPIADLSSHIMYIIEEQPLVNDELKIIERSASILSHSIHPNKVFCISPEIINLHESVNHEIGGISIVLDDLEIADKTIKKIIFKANYFCEVLAIGKERDMKKWEECLMSIESNIKKREFTQINLHHQNNQESIHCFDSLAYFQFHTKS